MKNAYIVLVCYAFLSLSLNGYSQEDPVLFYYGDDSVTQSEFEYVFLKNNNTKQGIKEVDVKDYLDLYINFKLKVREAEAFRIDTIPHVAHELKAYHDQLLKSYVEKKLFDSLVEETFNRLHQDVHIQHIAIRLPANAIPADTLKAYQKIMEARKRVIRGESFTDVALDVSEDPYVNDNKGDLGYISAPLRDDFYAFETVAYETPVGNISMPVKSPMGYHIIKVMDRRDAIGKIQVAHILIRLSEDPTEEEVEAKEERARLILSQIEEGVPFEELASSYSEDKQSAGNGGLLDPFGTGTMVASFEKAAFDLEEDGDVSDRVRTNLGFHIIKRIRRIEPPGREEVKTNFQKRLTSGPRFDKAREELIRQYKDEYSYMMFPSALKNAYKLVDSSILKNQWEMPMVIPDENLFMIDDQTYDLVDFMRYVEDNQRSRDASTTNGAVDHFFNEYVQRKVMEYGIAQEYEDYRRLRQEYRDGIVMFELMESQVWNKAIKDTAGLEAYYEAHQGDYMWPERVDVDIFRVSDERLAKKVKRKAKRKSNDWILEKYNDDEGNPAVVITEGKYVKGQDEKIDRIEWKEGWSEMIMNEDGSITLIRVNKVLEPMPKSLAEARGFYIADYQDYLESQWLEDLREKYPVKLNEEVLENLFE